MTVVNSTKKVTSEIKESINELTRADNVCRVSTLGELRDC